MMQNLENITQNKPFSAPKLFGTAKVSLNGFIEKYSNEKYSANENPRGINIQPKNISLLKIFQGKKYPELKSMKYLIEKIFQSELGQPKFQSEKYSNIFS